MMKPSLSVIALVLIHCFKFSTGNDINLAKPTETTEFLDTLATTTTETAPESSRGKRMIDAEVTTIEKFPYLAFLEPKKSYHCGSAIISPYHILTAAHCVMYDDPRDVQMRVGSSFRIYGGSEHRVLNFTKHPKFHIDKHGNSENDVAVLLLEKPIDFINGTVSSIVMYEYGEKIRLGSAAKIAGWGRTHPDGFLSSYLRSIKMEVVDKKNCYEVYKDIDGIQAGEICAVASEKETQSPCMGDSGGPLVIKGRLAGFFTHTENCSTILYPTVFTEVSYFRNWIDQAIKDLDDARKRDEGKDDDRIYFPENEAGDDKQDGVSFVLMEKNINNRTLIRFPENQVDENRENPVRFKCTIDIGQEDNKDNSGLLRFPETDNDYSKRKGIRIRFPGDRK